MRSISLTCAAVALAAAVGLAVVFTVRDIADGPEPTPAPSPTPSMPDGVELVRVPRGGQLYDCVVYYNGGIWCWPDPAPNPTPRETPPWKSPTATGPTASGATTAS